MKAILLFWVLLGLCGGACAGPRQVKPRAAEAAVQEHPSKVTSRLIQAGYTLFEVSDVRRPPGEHLTLLAKRGETQVNIRDTAGFARIVSGIVSPADALELVRLLTSQELRPFLADVFYTEVHQQADTQDRWFAIEAAQYAQWKLHAPVITAEQGKYKIERFVASYPRILPKNQQPVLIPAQLLKIWEWVDAHGNYSVEIKDVLAEGDAIQKMLIFTK